MAYLNENTLTLLQNIETETIEENYLNEYLVKLHESVYPKYYTLNVQNIVNSKYENVYLN